MSILYNLLEQKNSELKGITICRQLIFFNILLICKPEEKILWRD